MTKEEKGVLIYFVLILVAGFAWLYYCNNVIDPRRDEMYAKCLTYQGEEVNCK